MAFPIPIGRSPGLGRLSKDYEPSLRGVQKHFLQ